MALTLVRADTLLDGTGAPAIRGDAAVLIEDGTIREVGRSSAVTAPASAEIVQLEDATIVPGIVDGYVHLILGTPGDPFHQLAQRDQQRMFAWGAANALACLAAGLTTIFDCGGPGDATIQLRDAFQDGLVSGPRVLAAGARIMTTAGHCHWLGETIEYLDYDDAVARQMGQQGTYVDFNIGGAIGRLRGRDGVPREWPYGETVPETRWEIGRQMQRYGVRVYLTSDAIGRAYDTLPRNVISMPERFGEAPADLISRITSVPAQALGLEEQIGTIRPGLSADLLVVRGDAERDLSGLLRPELVFLRGELVAERGRVSLPSRHTGSP